MIRDLRGNIVPYAKTTKTVSENFLASTSLPNWLNVNNNNYNIYGLSTTRGHIELFTSNTANENTTLNIFPNGINIDFIKEIKLEFDSLSFTSSGITFSMSFCDSQGNGIELIDNDSIPFSVISNNNGIKTTKTLPYNLRNNSGYDKRRNISVIVRDDNTFILSECDSVIYEYQFSDSELNLNGVLYPRISICANVDNVKRKMEFSCIRLSVSHN